MAVVAQQVGLGDFVDLVLEWYELMVYSFMVGFGCFQCNE